MNEDGWKRQDGADIAEKVHTKQQLKPLRPPRRGREVFFFAAGPFFKHPVFLAPAFAFGGFLLREPSSSSLSPSSAFALPFSYGVVSDTVLRPTCVIGFLLISFAKD